MGVPSAEGSGRQHVVADSSRIGKLHKTVHRYRSRIDPDAELTGGSHVQPRLGWRERTLCAVPIDLMFN